MRWFRKLWITGVITFHLLLNATLFRALLSQSLNPNITNSTSSYKTSFPTKKHNCKHGKITRATTLNTLLISSLMSRTVHNRVLSLMSRSLLNLRLKAKLGLVLRILWCARKGRVHQFWMNRDRKLTGKLGKRLKAVKATILKQNQLKGPSNLILSRSGISAEGKTKAARQEQICTTFHWQVLMQIYRRSWFQTKRRIR